MITVVGMYDRLETSPTTVVINTTSRAADSWHRDFSPFFLGPVCLYDGHVSLNMENAWQFSKVYQKHTSWDKEPTAAYWEWAKAGWADEKAHRYPMGKGAVPNYSYWNGKKLDYVSARKAIYAPLYAEAVMKTAGWKKLVALHRDGKDLILRDFDGYNHKKLGMSLTDVLNITTKKTGHAFVLAMLLSQDVALDQIESPSRWRPLLEQTI